MCTRPGMIRLFVLLITGASHLALIGLPSQSSSAHTGGAIDSFEEQLTPRVSFGAAATDYDSRILGVQPNSLRGIVSATGGDMDPRDNVLLHQVNVIEVHQGLAVNLPDGLVERTLNNPGGHKPPEVIAVLKQCCRPDEQEDAAKLEIPKGTIGSKPATAWQSTAAHSSSEVDDSDLAKNARALVTELDKHKRELTGTPGIRAKSALNLMKTAVNQKVGMFKPKQFAKLLREFKRQLDVGKYPQNGALRTLVAQYDDSAPDSADNTEPSAPTPATMDKASSWRFRKPGRDAPKPAYRAPTQAERKRSQSPCRDQAFREHEAQARQNALAGKPLDAPGYRQSLEAALTDCATGGERSIGPPAARASSGELADQFEYGRTLNGVSLPVLNSDEPRRFTQPTNLYRTAFERIELRGNGRPLARDDLCADTVSLDLRLEETVPASLVGHRAGMRVAALGAAIQGECAGRRPEARECTKERSPLGCPVSSRLEVRVFWREQPVARVVADATTYWNVAVEPNLPDNIADTSTRLAPAEPSAAPPPATPRAELEARRRQTNVIRDVQLVSASGKGCILVHDARGQDRLAGVSGAIADDFQRLERGQDAVDSAALPPPLKRAAFSLSLSPCLPYEQATHLQVPQEMIRALRADGSRMDDEVTPTMFAKLIEANMQHAGLRGDRYDIVIRDEGLRLQLKLGARCIAVADARSDVAVMPCLDQTSLWTIDGVGGAPIDRYGAFRLRKVDAACLTVMDDAGLAVAACREPSAPDAAAQLWYARGRNDCFYTDLPAVRPVHLATGETRMVCE